MSMVDLEDRGYAFSMRHSARLASFTPLSLGSSVIGWWDPSDAANSYTDAGTTLVSADAQAIYRLADKSGNGYHLNQVTAGNRPLHKTGILNGWPVARYDGVDDYHDGTTQSFDDYTLFVIGKVVARTTNEGFVSLHPAAGNDNDQANGLAIAQNATNGLKVDMLATGGGGVSFDQGDFTTGFNIFEITTTTSNNQVNTWRNGTAVTANGGAAARTANATGGILLGARFQAGVVATAFSGQVDIASALLLDGVQTASVRSLVRSYFGTRFGITVV